MMNKAIFTKSFSQSLGNFSCIYICYIDRFSDVLFKFYGLFPPFLELEFVNIIL